MRRSGFEVPLRSEVDGRAAGHRTDVQIARPSVIQLLLDDHVGAVRADVRKVLPVRRELDVTVDVAIVGQPRDLAVDRHGPEIRALVRELLAPMRVGGERDQLAGRVPRQAFRPQIGIRQNSCVAPGGRRDLDAGRRTRVRIGHRKWSAVALKVLPVEDGALEALLVTFFEVARVGRRRFRLHLLLCLHHPRAVRARHWHAAGTCAAAPAGHRGAALDRDRRRRWLRRIDLPLLSVGGVVKPVVVGPAEAADLFAAVHDLPRCRGRVGGNDERLRRAAGVGVLRAAGHREAHPLAVRGDRRVADRLDAVVVLNRERTGCRGLRRRTQDQARGHQRPDTCAETERSQASHGDLQEPAAFAAGRGASYQSREV